ncbi:MAG: acyl-homoserine-lactone synthase [Hyphomonadaceae bacterium]|nr:acyl-homoserine-lactone synthase [Hyphomonadaceae bacterium]
MLHVVTAANRSIYEAPLAEMHRLRWNYYVEERGWRELREMQKTPGLEYDPYDDDEAIYLLALDAGGAFAGCIRLRRTDDRSLLTDRFSHLVENWGATKLGADVWEITRVVRRREHRTQDRLLRMSMNCAMLELAVSRRVRMLVGTTDSFMVPHTREFWREKVRPLGLPQPYEEGEAIALAFEVDPEGLRAIRERAGLSVPQIFEAAPPFSDREYTPHVEARVASLMHGLPSETSRELLSWLEARAANQAGEARVQ